MKKIFIQFLKDNGVFYDYVRNWVMHDDVFGDYKTRRINHPSNYLCRAFLWADTPEGCDLWEDLETKWFKELKKHGRL